MEYRDPKPGQIKPGTVVKVTPKRGADKADRLYRGVVGVLGGYASNSGDAHLIHVRHRTQSELLITPDCLSVVDGGAL